MKLSIRWQLTIIAVIFLFSSLTALTMITQHIISSTYEKKINADNKIIAQNIATNVSDFIYNVVIVNRMVSDYPRILDMPLAKQKEILMITSEKYPWLNSLTILRADGHQVAGFCKDNSGAVVYDAWVKHFVTLHHTSENDLCYYIPSSPPVLIFVHSIYRDKKFFGWSIASVHLSHLYQIIDRFNTANGNFTYLLNGNGLVLLPNNFIKGDKYYNYKTDQVNYPVLEKNGYPSLDETGAPLVNHAPFKLSASFQNVVNRVLVGENGTASYYDIDGEHFLCAYRSIEFPGMSEKWSIITVQRYATIMSFVYSTTKASIYVLLLVTAIVVHFIFIFSYRMTKPLIKMSEATQKVASGDLNVHINTRRRDEIGQLAANFNKMVENLISYRRERNEAIERMKHMAFHDPLTNLYNREYLHMYFAEQLESFSQKFAYVAIYYIDLDEFKSINDTLGHDAGDQVLIKASHRLLKAASSDSCVYRLGGDEFLVVKGVRSLNDADAVARDIFNYFNEDVYISDRLMHLAGSIGISIYPKDARTMDELINNADTAMYIAKKSGRNQWHFFQNKRRDNGKSLTVEKNKLITPEQISILYQGQFYNGTQHLIGYYTMFRLHTSNRNVLANLCIAEDDEKLPIDYWIFHQLCKFIKNFYIVNKKQILLFVPLFQERLSEMDFIEKLQKIVANYDCEPSSFAIVFSEAALREAMRRNEKTLNTLREIGFKIALDGFKIGSSSLAYLNALPINIICIDRNFTAQLLTDHMQQQVIHSIIDLAHRSGIETLAEGIDSQQQLDILAEYGCDYMQGPFFSHPQTANDILNKQLLD